MADLRQFDLLAQARTLDVRQIAPWLATSSSGRNAVYRSPSFSMITVCTVVAIPRSLEGPTFKEPTMTLADLSRPRSSRCSPGRCTSCAWKSRRLHHGAGGLPEWASQSAGATTSTPGRRRPRTGGFSGRLHRRRAVQARQARDQPPEVFSKNVTPHCGLARPAHVLLPVIPAPHRRAGHSDVRAERTRHGGDCPQHSSPAAPAPSRSSPRGAMPIGDRFRRAGGHCRPLSRLRVYLRVCFSIPT